MTDMDPGIRFPGESEEYRHARNRLLEAESELRREIKRSPRSGVRCRGAASSLTTIASSDVRRRRSADRELFEAGKDTLVIYSFMFPRYSGDTRPGLRRRDCGFRCRRPRARRAPRSWTRWRAAPQLDQGINLAVVVKSDPDRIRNFARERGWITSASVLAGQHLQPRLQRETPEGEQMPIVRPLSATATRAAIRGPRSSCTRPGKGMEARHVDSIWPIWNVLDVTPEGRGDESNFPALAYR